MLAMLLEMPEAANKGMIAVIPNEPLMEIEAHSIANALRRKDVPVLTSFRGNAKKQSEKAKLAGCSLARRLTLISGRSSGEIHADDLVALEGVDGGDLERRIAVAAVDMLVVDLPPGTGDAQLTMAQRVPLSGAVIVSTPQDLALIDARRGIAMFQKVDVPLLGIIENMSSFCCPNCGHISPIFGHGGARHEAERLDVPFLGEVP